MVEALAFHIREGTEADLPALEWEGEYSRFRQIYRASLEAARRGERMLLVAEVDRKVVGQIFVNFQSPWTVPNSDGRAGYLYAFRVRPGHRGLGIGRALLEGAETALRRAGVDHAVIAVARSNHEARRLYQRRGYRWLADDPGDWTYSDEKGRRQAVNEPAFVLSKRLADA